MVLTPIPSTLAERETWRIGVIADTHNRWRPEIIPLFAGVNEIWHLGDVCQENILDNLRAMCDRVICVLGNNDYLDYPLTRKELRFGEKFYLIHIPPRMVMEKSDWLLHGHTHVPRNEVLHGVHFFNPGSAGLANRGAPLSVGILSKTGKEPFRAEVIRV
ncbi:MAG: metallophosphoesterase [Candidatus Methylacidiphilales bacterium]|nr:metallophosphoesterase family protein [Candidatus Methylacidiphilales bacterium]